MIPIVTVLKMIVYQYCSFHDLNLTSNQIVDDDNPDGTIAIVEIKASDWDRMTDLAVRRNVRRQIKQIWDYIESQIIVKGEYVPTGEQKTVCPGIIFPKRPKDKNRLELIEKVFK